MLSKARGMWEVWITERFLLFEAWFNYLYTLSDRSWTLCSLSSVDMPRPFCFTEMGGEHAIPKLMDFRVSRCWTSGSPAVGLPGLQHCKQTPFLCKPCSFSYRSHAMAFCHSNRKQATSAESLPGLIPGNQSPELTSKHIRHTSRCFPVQLGLGCILRAPT